MTNETWLGSARRHLAFDNGAFRKKRACPNIALAGQAAAVIASGSRLDWQDHRLPARAFRQPDRLDMQPQSHRALRTHFG